MSVKRFSIAFIIIAIVILGFFTVNASTNSEIIDNYEEEIKIREVILDYFDRRYDSRMNNQLANFSELTDGSPQADDFLKSESDKLEIEIYNAKTHHLRYIQYKYILDFKEVSIDEENNSAIVALTEGHNVVFEISKMIDKKEPVISKMRNLAHTIILNKTQGRWKIISDNYDDQLWRMIRASNLSKEEIFTMIDAEQAQPSDIENVESTTFSCNLQSDESTHPYTRNGAIAYAHQYALYPNPEYYYFPDNDCTNFVNQAIYHGSNGEKVGSNTYGWYYNYYNNVYDNDYSASWTHVQFLYDFITQYLVWNKGPEGCEINNNYDALEGDLVQFEWKDYRLGSYCDHCKKNG